jgi:hypothetical protein
MDFCLSNEKNRAMKFLPGLLLLSVLFLQDANAQLFNKALLFNGNSALLSDCTPRANGNNLVVGAYTSSRALLAELNQDGDTLWVKEFNLGNNTSLSHVRELPNQTILVAGKTQHGGAQNAFLAKFDAQGNILNWKIINHYNNRLVTINDLVVDPSGNIYIAGHWTDLYSGGSVFQTWTIPLLIKLNPDYSTNWVRTYGIHDADDRYSGTVSNIGFDNNGDLCTWGYHTALRTVINIELYVAKWTTDGNLIWAKQRNSTLFNRTEGRQCLGVDDQNNLYVTSNNFIQAPPSIRGWLIEKYSASGNLLWAKTYKVNGNHIRANSLVIKQDKIYLMTHRDSASSNYDGLLVVLDTSGAVLSNQILGTVTANMTVKAVHDHHFLMVGRLNNVNNDAANVIQFGENGILSCPLGSLPFTVVNESPNVVTGINPSYESIDSLFIANSTFFQSARSTLTHCTAVSPCFTTYSTDHQIACGPFTWINGITYTNPNNTDTVILTNAAGCDSIITLNLSFSTDTVGIDNQIACDSYVWIDGNTYTASNNTAQYTLTNVAGCDSVVTLQLTIYNASNGIDLQSACDSFTWIDGNTYTSSNNTAQFTLTNQHGCDSVVTLNLTINNSTTNTVTETACNAYTWSLDGNTYTNSGTYTYLGTNAGGCPLTTTLNLTINQSSNASLSETACDSYTWALNGITYTSSGNYTHVINNAAGCDSIITLNLTINNSTSATQNESACDTYTWSLNGTTYNTSGNYTYVQTNTSGCDFTTTLNLIINNATIDTLNESACDSYVWALNGTTYTTSGIYTYNGTGTNGCPLTSTLILTINDTINASMTETACDAYLWNLNGTNYSSSGTYTHVSTSPTGCLLTTTLFLTVNNSTTVTLNETACGTYLWGLNGNSYNTSGNYTYLDTNAAGCPQTTTLNLIIHSIDTSAFFNGTTITANAIGASYQWIDCNNGNAAIAGATSQSFMPLTNGNYAVIISDTNCSDTSACYLVTAVGIDKLEPIRVTVYPNPTSGNLQINLGNTYPETNIRLMNALGQSVLNETHKMTGEINLSIEEAPGVYVLEVETKEQSLVRLRILKN